MIWDTGNLDPTQRGLVNQALAMCQFNWDLLLPGLQKGNQWSQPGRTSIPVYCKDLRSFGAVQESDQFHMLGIDENGFVTEENVKAVLGLFWFDGRVEVEQTLVSQPSMFMEVFLSEGAHASDFYYLWPNNLRPTLTAIYHPNGPDTHGYFEGPYFDMVGEAYMGGFYYASTDRPPTLLGFTHPSTQAVALKIKQLLKIGQVEPQPPLPPSGIDWSKVSDAEFDAEFNRRYGFFKDMNIDQGFTKSGRRWQGHFVAQ